MKYSLLDVTRTVQICLGVSVLTLVLRRQAKRLISALDDRAWRDNNTDLYERYRVLLLIRRQVQGGSES